MTFCVFFFRVDTGTSKYTYMYTIPEESRYKGWDFPNPMLFDPGDGIFRPSLLRMIGKGGRILRVTPLKIKMEPKNEGYVHPSCVFIGPFIGF